MAQHISMRSIPSPVRPRTAGAGRAAPQGRTLPTSRRYIRDSSTALAYLAVFTCLAAAILFTAPVAIAQSPQPDSALLRSIPGAFSEPPTNGNGLRIAPGSKATLQPPASAPADAASATPDPEAIVRALTGAEPLQPPRDITRTGYWQANARWLLPLVVVLLLIAAALGFILYRRRRRPVVLSPQLLALQGIDDATAYSDDKLFAVHVSNAVRTYLEARFHLRAPEQTTEEFLQEAHGGTHLPQPAVQTLAHLLELCDLAKFARQGLSAAQRSELAESARQLVQSLGQPQSADNT